MGNWKFGGDLSGVKRCPHCAIANPQMVEMWKSKVIEDPDNSDRGKQWGAYRCSTCANLILAEGEYCHRPRDGVGFLPNDAIETIYPGTKSVAKELPASAKTYLEQAGNTLHAPDASVLMSGSAVDAMLKHLGYTEGTLYSRIDKAVQDHVLTVGMGQWAHKVRLESNNVRHADASRPHMTKEDAEKALEFTRSLGDFLFVLTAKIDAAVAASGGPSN